MSSDDKEKPATPAIGRDNLEAIKKRAAAIEAKLGRDVKMTAKMSHTQSREAKDKPATPFPAEAPPQPPLPSAPRVDDIDLSGGTIAQGPGFPSRELTPFDSSPNAASEVAVVAPSPPTARLPLVAATPLVEPSPRAVPLPLVAATPLVEPSPRAVPLPLVAATPLVEPSPLVAPSPLIAPTSPVAPPPPTGTSPWAQGSSTSQVKVTPRGISAMANNGTFEVPLAMPAGGESDDSAPRHDHAKPRDIAPPIKLAPTETVEGESPTADKQIASDGNANVEPSTGPKTATMLLWLDRKCMPRVYRNKAWQRILDELDDQPIDTDFDDPGLSRDSGETEDRTQALEILTRGAPANGAAVHSDLVATASQQRRFAAPLALLEGELELTFDERETLEATVSAATPLAHGNKAVSATLDVAKEYLATPDLLGAPSVADGLTRRFHETLDADGTGADVVTALKAHVARALLEGRRYRQRKLLGGMHLRGLLRTTADSPGLVVYLPQSAVEELPLRASFRVRMIAEVHFAVDAQEQSEVALRVAALAQVFSL